ncbi:MAG: SPOR domain-containing protein [Bacteroidales bacterium]|nr:SPOR domain-containing protein [Bacteroidales bacterium]
MDVVISLSNLLFEHNRIVVNGLGVFTTELVSAYVHPVDHSFNPEFKKIKFEVSTQIQDDLLAKTIGGADANERIEDFVRDVKKNLKAGQKIQLKNIGYLFSHHTGEIILEQDHAFNYVKKNFGLQSFTQKPVKKTVPSEKPIAVLPSVKEKSNSKVIIIILWVLALVLAGVAFWQAENIGSLFEDKPVAENTVDALDDKEVVENRSSTTILVDSSMEEGNISTDTLPSEIVISDGVLDTATVSDEIPVENAVVEEPSEVAKVAVKHDGPRYYVIAGCFESKFKANRMLEELKSEGFENAVLDGKIGRLHRVCYDIYDNRPQASNYMLKLKKAGRKGVWIQKK